MKLHKWEDVRAELAREDPGFEEAVEKGLRQYHFAMGLKDLRQGRGVRQTDLAEALGMTQSNVSRIEREDRVPEVEDGEVDGLAGVHPLLPAQPERREALGERLRVVLEPLRQFLFRETGRGASFE